MTTDVLGSGCIAGPVFNSWLVDVRFRQIGLRKAGLGRPYCAGAASAGYSDHVTSKVRWVLAGIGDIARKRVIAAIQSEPRSELYGFVTRDPVKARPYAGARAWVSVEEAVADPDVDAVYIALPVAMHADAAIAALRAGKHVLCEKPMALNFAQAERMVAEGRTSGRLLGVSYYRRLYPKLIRARKLIAEGAIGAPLLAEANCHGWLPTEGRDWLRNPALAGGGPLFDIASHRIDAMNFLFGQAERACGMLSNAVHRIAVEDSATVVMKFPGGVHGVVDVRWNSRVARDQFRIIGVDGEIGLDPLNGPEIRVAHCEGSRVEELPPHANLHYPIIENFVDAVRTGDPARLACPAEQAAWVDWTIEQVVRSQRTPGSAGLELSARRDFLVPLQRNPPCDIR
jgi:1,5-anhydro-D-fructose reductase (1,5-anhydro-D-mannitol-forming)